METSIISKEIHEPNFYIHENPEPVIYGDDNMPMTIEEPDAATPGHLRVDDGSGRERPMTKEEAMSLVKRVPDGINVPGYQNPNTRQTQQPPMKQPLKKEQKPQPSQPVVHPPQNFYQQQYTQPVQPVYPPQAYPPQAYPPQGYPLQQPHQVPIEPQREVKLVPPTEMAMSDSAYYIFVDLAGVDKSTLKITYANTKLGITGNRESAVEKLKKELKKTAKSRKSPIKKSSTTVPEFMSGKFSYEYTFNKRVEESEITADFVDGVLHIKLPHRIKGDEVKISLTM